MKVLKNKENLKLICALTVVLTFTMTTCVFAAGNPGVELGNWIQTNVAGVFVGVLAVIGVIVLIKRQLMTALVILIFAGLGSLFVFGGKSFASQLQSIISAWF